MQCPVCKHETVHYMHPSEVPVALHDVLLAQCSFWECSPGICCACMDALDFQQDSTLQHLLNGTTPPDPHHDPLIVSLSAQEQGLWFHMDDRVRLWFRAEMRKQVRASAVEQHYLYWSIADANKVLLDYGEIPNDWRA